MIPSIATVTLGGDLPGRINAAAEAGFQAIELFDSDLQEFGESPARVKQLADAAGLRIASYFPLRDVDGVPEVDVIATRTRAAAYLDQAVELGAQMVMMCSATNEESSGCRSLIVNDLLYLADMAKERNLRLAYEALSWGRHTFDYRDAAALVRKVNHPHLGLVLDSFHIFARGHTTDEIAKIPAEHIFLVQVSDTLQLNIDYLEWSRHHRTLPGRGVVDLQAFTAKVRATGYDGVFSLECFSDELKTASASAVADAGFTSMSNLWSADNTC